MTPPAYVLVRSEDLRLTPELTDYVTSVDASLEKYGAEILVQNLPARVLEGEWGGFVTLLRFESVAAAERWYDSEEYSSIKGLRQASSTPTTILVEGIAEGHRSSDLATLFGMA